MERVRHIAFHVPVWKRIVITRAMYFGLRRIITEFEQIGITAEVHIAGDEEEHEQLANEFGWNYHHVKNKNLGWKNEQLLLRMLESPDWQVLIQLGSDDFLLPNATRVYQRYFQETKFAAFNTLYFFDATTGEGTKMEGYLCGAGRFIARDILETTIRKCQRVWEWAGIGNDGKSAANILTATGLSPVVMPDCVVADVKTSVNVTPFFRQTEEEYDIREIIPEHLHFLC